MPQPTQQGRARILVVDDDPGICEVLCDYLGRHGFDTMAAGDGPAMDRAIADRTPDLVVLDLMLPGEGGLSICRRLAEKRVPVIMLTAMHEVTDRVVGLELGADDYLGKPCEPRELLARVRAVLRRQKEQRQGETAVSRLEFGGWTLDLVGRSLQHRSGGATTLSGGEFNLLKALAERPGRVLTRDVLLDLVKGPDAESFDRAIDVQVSRLRRKLEDGSGAEVITTVRGEGYMFVPAVRRS